MTGSTSTHYGTVGIAIHWLTAALILVMLVLGFSAANAHVAAVQVGLLRAHVALGTFITLLTLFRVVWWLFFDSRPALAETDPWEMRVLARLVHGLLYVLVLLLASSGIATLFASGALAALAGARPLPDFSVVVPHTAHAALARVLIALALGHIGAALYHQFVTRDNLLARMGIGTRHSA